MLTPPSHPLPPRVVPLELEFKAKNGCVPSHQPHFHLRVCFWMFWVGKAVAQATTTKKRDDGVPSRKHWKRSDVLLSSAVVRMTNSVHSMTLV
eukprot:3262473-Amphidinium_carterae.1